VKQVVIIGAGGQAREVTDIIEVCNQNNFEYELLGYIVDPKFGSPGTLINDLPILGGFDWISKYANQVFIICGVGASHQRFQLIQRSLKLGCKYFSIIHPAASITRRVSIGEGVIINANASITNQIMIGDHVLINQNSTIGHDCKIDDFVTISPGANISGNVIINRGCYIGTGAIVIEKIEIGSWAIIGAGSTIIQNVMPNTTVVGVPGKVIKTRDEGWYLDA